MKRRTINSLPGRRRHGSGSAGPTHHGYGRGLPLHLAVIALALSASVFAEDTAPVCMANGIKMGEVSPTSAIIWTRLTRHPERNLNGLDWAGQSAVPEGKALGDMRDAVPGAPGEIRVGWSLDGEPVESTGWLAVDPEKDFTRQVLLSALTPGRRYAVTVSSRSPGGAAGQTVTGSFRTAPLSDQAVPVLFTVVTGQEFSRRDDAENGHMIYPRMLALHPDFFVHTGDIVYYDYGHSVPMATHPSLARFKWNRMYALPFQRSFHSAVASYFLKDDHDTLKDDCWPGQVYGDLTWDQGLSIFREQVPMGDNTYRTVRWGKDLQVWFVEGRDFRSANTKPDGPGKTIWGAEQKAWFFRTVSASDATFRLLISPTPVVGPDRPAKNDNHANAGFSHEGNEIRAFIEAQRNMYVVCGDRHWQYISVDPATGVREYSCGPTSMKHAGGFSESSRSDMHRYLKIVGGFLAVQIRRDGDRAVAVFRHHGVDGSVLNEDVVSAE